MRYVKFGRLAFEVSMLGLGCMRLPLQNEQLVSNTASGRLVDRALSVQLIRESIDLGINYIDTAYTYQNGQSELAVGEALTDGYREKVKLATKLPVQLVKQATDLDRFLELQLGRLKTDYVDFYLLHGLRDEWWDKMTSMDVLGYFDKWIGRGQIRHAGFSFHGSYDLFKLIIDSYDWAMCLVQQNYSKPEDQAGVRGVRYAASKGVPVVIMGPLLGGRLADPPPEVAVLLEKRIEKRSPIEWAFRWPVSLPGVITVLSGMSSVEQVRENVRLFDTIDIGPLSEEEKEVYDKAAQSYRSRRKHTCTGCGYCMPCPHHVHVSFLMYLYGELSTYGATTRDRETYHALQEQGRGASSCRHCGSCVSRCPQHLPVAELLRELDGILSMPTPTEGNHMRVRPRLPVDLPDDRCRLRTR